MISQNFDLIFDNIKKEGSNCISEIDKLIGDKKYEKAKEFLSNKKNLLNYKIFRELN
jgi:hypothetical protein